MVRRRTGYSPIPSLQGPFTSGNSGTCRRALLPWKIVGRASFRKAGVTQESHIQAGIHLELGQSMGPGGSSTTPPPPHKKVSEAQTPEGALFLQHPHRASAHCARLRRTCRGSLQCRIPPWHLQPSGSCLSRSQGMAAPSSLFSPFSKAWLRDESIPPAPGRRGTLVSNPGPSSWTAGPPCRDEPKARCPTPAQTLAESHTRQPFHQEEAATDSYSQEVPLAQARR